MDATHLDAHPKVLSPEIPSQNQSDETVLSILSDGHQIMNVTSSSVAGKRPTLSSFSISDSRNLSSKKFKIDDFRHIIKNADLRTQLEADDLGTPSLRKAPNSFFDTSIAIDITGESSEIRRANRKVASKFFHAAREFYGEALFDHIYPSEERNALLVKGAPLTVAQVKKILRYGDILAENFGKDFLEFLSQSGQQIGFNLSMALDADKKLGATIANIKTKGTVMECLAEAFYEASPAVAAIVVGVATARLANQSHFAERIVLGVFTTMMTRYGHAVIKAMYDEYSKGDLFPPLNDPHYVDHHPPSFSYFDTRGFVTLSSLLTACDKMVNNFKNLHNAIANFVEALGRKRAVANQLAESEKAWNQTVEIVRGYVDQEMEAIIAHTKTLPPEKVYPKDSTFLELMELSSMKHFHTEEKAEKAEILRNEIKQELGLPGYHHLQRL